MGIIPASLKSDTIQMSQCCCQPNSVAGTLTWLQRRPWLNTAWMLHIAGRFHWLNLDFRRQVTALQTARQHFPVLLPLLCAGAVAFSCVLQSEIIFLHFFYYYFKASHLNHVLQFLMSFFVWQLRILHHRAPLPEEASWTKELEAAERVVVRVSTVVGARSVCKLRSA